MSARARLLACLLTTVCVLGVWPSGATARVIGRVVHVGFPAGFGHAIREGAWVPIVVDLSLEGQAVFDGFLRVEQPDRDGDLVVNQVEVHLRADGGASRRYTLYCVVGPSGGRPRSLSVDLLDVDGAVVEVVCDGELVRSLKLPQNPEAISDREYLILTLTPGVLGKILHLTTPDQADKFDRRIVLAHIQPEELPDRWQGLEAVDCIVWDAADATKLTGAQLEALVTWVRHGGLLMIAASQTADTLAKSKQIAPILPVEIGRADSTIRLGEFRKKLLGVRWSSEEQSAYLDAPDPEAESLRRYYLRKVPIVHCRTAPGAETVLREDEIQADMVARRSVGRGAVVFVAAELADLLNDEGVKAVEFYKRTLQLRAPRSDDPTISSTRLFPYLDSTVGFRRSTGLYLLGALLFAIAYLGIATFGSWTFLRSRGWTRHSWSAFSIVAGAATALSLFAVQGMRGVGQSLQQLTIVDATVGSGAAMATAYFGLKTGTHTVLDAWMPADYAQMTEPQRTACSLKPTPSTLEAYATGSVYADPARYRLAPASALLQDVPIRATLKQFEGRWFGHLRRTVEADVRIVTQRDDTGQSKGPSDDSTVTNNLGCGLTDCLLIQPRGDPFDSLVDQTPRHDKLLVFELGEIADGEKIFLADRIYTNQRTGAPVAVERWSMQTLGEFQKNWGRNVGLGTPFGGGSEVVRNLPLERYQDALLMLTARREHFPANAQGYLGGQHDFSARNCSQLDLSDRLTTDYVLLIGFAEDQGPVMLCTRKGKRAFRPLEADRAFTVYRFMIPVRRM
ncbi:MAG: hypothetical protein ACYSUQ_01000 [Planctomycetota bacterium]